MGTHYSLQLIKINLENINSVQQTGFHSNETLTQTGPVAGCVQENT